MNGITSFRTPQRTSQGCRSSAYSSCGAFRTPVGRSSTAPVRLPSPEAMPTGPDGQKRPRSVTANAVHACRVMLGLDDEEYVEGAELPRRPLRKKRRREVLDKEQAEAERSICLACCGMSATCPRSEMAGLVRVPYETPCTGFLVRRQLGAGLRSPVRRRRRISFRTRSTR